jgi:hypothetical protein
MLEILSFSSCDALTLPMSKGAPGIEILHMAEFAPFLEGTGRYQAASFRPQKLKTKPRTKFSASLFAASSSIKTIRQFLRKSTRTILGKPFRNDLPFEATEKPPYYIVLLHLIPVVAAIVIISLNIYGYWIGKGLSGNDKENAPKALAFQLTAKLHELFMLASLNDLLVTYMLRMLAVGHGVPFGSLTIGSRFKDLSYIWSRDFWAIVVTKYHRRSCLVTLTLVCLILGVFMGPSSATALIPRLDIWPAGGAVMTLNTSDNLLWPSTLEVSTSGPGHCDHSTLGCFNPLAWDSVGANFFSYWGYTTMGGSSALPEHISVPSISSLRSMDIRLRDSVGPSVPPFTVASVQHAVIGDMVNSFRFLTFPSRSAKCRKSWSSAMCSYQDVSWFVKAMQPVVVTACLTTQLKSSLIEFPVIDYASNPLKTASILLNVSFGEHTQPQFHWVSTDNNLSLLNASIAVVVRLSSAPDADQFACTIQSQWADSITSTSFTGTTYIVDGSVLGLNFPLTDKGGFQGRHVSIDSQWAQRSVDNPLMSQENTTAFENFVKLGKVSSDLSIKLEAILSILFSETMTHTASGAIPLFLDSKDLYLVAHGDLLQGDKEARAAKSVANQSIFHLKTSMTGYGYGLYTMSGLSLSTLTSIIALCIYSAIALGHLALLYISNDLYIVSWREETDLLLTCLCSRFKPTAPGMDMAKPKGDGEAKQHNEEWSILKDVVVVTGKRQHAELSFRRKDWPEEV